jgi:hypothetical protein
LLPAIPASLPRGGWNRRAVNNKDAKARQYEGFVSTRDLAGSSCPCRPIEQLQPELQVYATIGYD